MKKFALTVVLALSIMTVSAVSAQAASLRVYSTKASARATGLVVFKARTTRPSRVKFTVYKGGRAIRTIRAIKSGKRYVAVWNQRDSRGRALAAGTYAYRVTAVRRSVARSVSGKVKLRGRTPAPTPTPVPTPTLTPTPTPTPTVAAASRWFGFYVDGNLNTMAPLLATESLVETRAHVAQLFMGDDEPFPAARVNAITEHGSIPLVTLQFNSLWTGGLDALNSGGRDSYIIAFADAAKANGKTIWLRPFHEMNGNWDAWSGTTGTNTPAKLVQAWRHVHDIFVARGADNVKFVWCPNDSSVPNTAENAIQNYWPGDAYIDYAAVDIYNFGTSQTWSHWTPFGNAFTGPYNVITSLTNKPFFIAEIGCSETGGDKAAWLTDMFQKIRTTYTKVTGVVWFDINKETDWRVNSSTASLNTFKTQLASGY